MKSNVQVLVQKIKTIHTVTELGRYVEITPLSNILGAHSIGVEVEVFDRTGKSVCGVIVNPAAEGVSFPTVSGLVLDTTPHVGAKPQYKRMQVGGVKGGGPAYNVGKAATK